MSEPDIYQCSACGKAFRKTRDEAEAQDAHELFGEMPREKFAVVCNDCWRKLLAI